VGLLSLAPVGYSDEAILAEGSHNGSAAVLKTAGRKAMQVRVLSPPPFTFIASSSHSNHQTLFGAGERLRPLRLRAGNESPSLPSAQSGFQLSVRQRQDLDLILVKNVSGKLRFDGPNWDVVPF
jgi:hypothetical protein